MPERKNRIGYTEEEAATLVVTKPRYRVKEQDGEWIVLSREDDVVGEWDTEEEAREHADVLRQSDEIAEQTSK